MAQESLHAGQWYEALERVGWYCNAWILYVSLCKEEEDEDYLSGILPQVSSKEEEGEEEEALERTSIKKISYPPRNVGAGRVLGNGSTPVIRQSVSSTLPVVKQSVAVVKQSAPIVVVRRKVVTRS